jgi:hypothetical protein
LELVRLVGKPYACQLHGQKQPLRLKLFPHCLVGQRQSRTI